jgi:hypothetical protein
MTKQTLAKAGLISLLAAAPAGLALAAANPSGHGQPGQDCVSIVIAGGTEPGHAASSLGSPFNEAALTGGPGGKGGQAYDAAGAPSQYDVACYQVSLHH